jgi:uncharacterized protein
VLTAAFKAIHTPRRRLYAGTWTFWEAVMQWVIKATKLCNLRCKYCYEWDHLSDPARMSDEVWTRTLIAIRQYREKVTEACGEPVPTDIIWHGGEPLTLPISYFKNVINLQKEIFPRDWLESGQINNCLQTNLYSISDEAIEFFREYSFNIGVSVDFCEGVRLSAGGQETQTRVCENLYRLQDGGVSFDLITVLAQHTISNLEHIFKQFAHFNTYVRLLPLFSGPAARPMIGVSVSNRDILNAMLKLFGYWFDAGMPFGIDPFEDAVRTIAMKKMGLQAPRKDRRRLGTEVLVIDRDGSLTCASFRYSGVIGNVAKQTIDEIIQSPAYQSVIIEETQLKKAICDGCSFIGACDTGPLARNFDSQHLQDCPTERYLYPMIEAYLVEKEFFNNDFNSMARHMKDAHLEEMLAPNIQYS